MCPCAHQRLEETDAPVMTLDWELLGRLVRTKTLDAVTTHFLRMHEAAEGLSVELRSDNDRVGSDR